MEQETTNNAEDGNATPWIPFGEFSWNHPSGWTITRYSVQGVRTYLLWDKEGKKYGPFRSAKEAQGAFDQCAPAVAIEPATDETRAGRDEKQ